MKCVVMILFAKNITQESLVAEFNWDTILCSPKYLKEHLVSNIGSMWQDCYKDNVKCNNPDLVVGNLYMLRLWCRIYLANVVL